MSSDADAPQGWLTKTLMNINNPFRKLFKEGTFASDMMNLGGGTLGIPGTWLKMVDYWTGEDEHKISSWDDAWKAGRHFFATDVWDGMDEAVWKYGVPLVASYYGGPYAGAAGAYVGNKLSGEDDKKAISSGIMSYGLGSIMEGVGAVSGGENSISNIFSGEGSVDKVMSEPSVWEKLLSTVTEGFDKSKQEGYTDFGTNEFAYMTGSIGDRLNPKGPLAGLGVDMARQRQYASALKEEEAKTTEQGASQLQALKDLLDGKVSFTPADKPGLTSMTVKAGKNGESVISTTGTLPNVPKEQQWSVLANQQTGTINVVGADGKPLLSNKWTPEIRAAYASAEEALRDPKGALSVAGVPDPANKGTNLPGGSSVGHPIETDYTKLAQTIQKFQPQQDRSGNWILSTQQQKELASMGIARQEDQLQFAKQMIDLKMRMGKGGESELDTMIKLARLQNLLNPRQTPYYNPETRQWETHPNNEPMPEGLVPQGAGNKMLLNEAQKVKLTSEGEAARGRINNGVGKLVNGKQNKGIDPSDITVFNTVQFELGKPEFYAVGEENAVMHFAPKSTLSAEQRNSIVEDMARIYRDAGTQEQAVKELLSIPGLASFFDMTPTNGKLRGRK